MESVYSQFTVNLKVRVKESQKLRMKLKLHCSKAVESHLTLGGAYLLTAIFISSIWLYWYGSLLLKTLVRAQIPNSMLDRPGKR